VKIIVRHAEPHDFEALRNIHAQPSAIRGTLQLPFPSAQKWRKRLEDVPNDRHFLVACVDGEIVGALDLWQETRSPRRRHAGVIGMAVHDSWHGQGVGNELMAAAIDLADNWLNLLRLELSVFVDNEPAIRLYTKWGFRTEGTWEKYAFRDGHYVDAYCMARIRDIAATGEHSPGTKSHD
jgi:putative acetyltransferase